MWRFHWSVWGWGFGYQTFLTEGQNFLFFYHPSNLTWASAQSDQHLCCSRPRQYDISSFYIGNFMTLAGFFSWADGFESYLVKNPENRFSCNLARIYLSALQDYHNDPQCLSSVDPDPTAILFFLSSWFGFMASQDYFTHFQLSQS